MIYFLCKGLLRDRSRSLIPFLVVTVGVALTVLMEAWISGAVGDIIETNAKFKDGHLKVLSRSYAEQQSQYPLDLSLTDTQHWLQILRQKYPSVNWQMRIYFGGLLDFPDENGETMAQGPVAGTGIDLLSPDSKEKEYFNLNSALVKGTLPQNPGEILVTDQFFERLHLSIGQSATLISVGMDGGMAVHAFKVVGTINFGVTGLDRGAIIADVSDVQEALNMIDATSEIFGYFKAGRFLKQQAMTISQMFNQAYSKPNDPFSPVMQTFLDGDIGQAMGFMDRYLAFILIIFVFIMAIVLWNSGIMNGIRRYGEIGIRLAMGETKNHIYFTMLGEALIVGIIGSILGTMVGLIPAYYLQEVGFDISSMMGSTTSSILISTIMRAQINSMTFWIGFIPGVLATGVGTLMAGIAIYQRQTAELFKELEI